MPRLSALSSRSLTGIGILTPVVIPTLASFSQTGLSQQGGNYVAAVDFGGPSYYNQIQFVAAVSADPAIYGGSYNPTLADTFQTIYDGLLIGSKFNFSYYNNSNVLVTLTALTLSSKTISTNPQGRPQLELYTVEDIYSLIGSGSVIENELMTDNAGTVTITAASIPVSPYVSGGVLTYNFQGTNGATTTARSSGSNTQAAITLYNAQISSLRGPTGGTSLKINNVNDARADITNMGIGSGTTFTIEGWVYFNQLFSGWSPNIFAIGENSQNLFCLRWGNLGAGVEFRTNLNNSSIGQGGQSGGSVTGLAAGVWQHHALTANGTTYNYYLDGQLKHTTSTGTWGWGTTAGKNIATWTLGNWLVSPFGSQQDQYMWNWRYSTGVLYTNNFTVNKTGLI